jgi:hypothetical protein
MTGVEHVVWTMRIAISVESAENPPLLPLLYSLYSVMITAPETFSRSASGALAKLPGPTEIRSALASAPPRQSQDNGGHWRRHAA